MLPLRKKSNTPTSLFFSLLSLLYPHSLFPLRILVLPLLGVLLLCDIFSFVYCVIIVVYYIIIIAILDAVNSTALFEGTLSSRNFWCIHTFLAIFSYSYDV